MPPITPRGREINADAARPLDAISLARTMLRSAKTAAIATLDPGGYPYSTATNIAVDDAGKPFIYMAGLSLHARNIALDDRVSITIADMDKDVLTTPRLSLVGRARRVEGAAYETLKQRYMERFPKSKLYLALPDSSIFYIETEAVQLNGGPTQNANSVTPLDLVEDLAPTTAG
ncbi:HugZ family protein [Camelimonas lactis]|uniref:Pyridoxamine 5'-phosphate oxidase n=1 Tax=Camelimonas lactis TaxID=659006 RepID=A0A4R2GMX6_9HYPH|nr:pyridoxamine 5'-phosphate oxidase family protein [Camelimonas lactis]TCO08963.1 pyridoxamine 5'-phosphate oxidase [Camelimonas lactis]